jgi:NRAMP (natural resistance-associated macrophage protein)-like metal ion transporter
MLRKLWLRALIVIGVLGPGFVTASAGNDVGGIFTYSQAGALYGYATLWTLVPLTISLIVVQEMVGRMGAVTGKGLAGLIRENFGVRITFFAMAALFFINTAISATEFAGIAAACEIFHLSRYIVVPVACLLVFLFVLRLPNKIVERVFVVLSFIYLGYIVSGILAKPDWAAVTRGTLVPTLSLQSGFIVIVVGLIGTTISPYMQFFLQSAVVEKGSRVRDLFAVRADIVVGSILAIVLAGFMIVANAATIWIENQHADAQHQITINTAVDVAVALQPLAGKYAAAVFGFGVLNAGLFTACVLPLATAYIVCEAFGFEAAVDRPFREAPVFYSLFAGALIAGALLVLIPNLPYLQLILFAQVLQGVVLPLELVMMLVIINRKRVMGNYTNTRTGNIISWITAIGIGILALIYVAQTVLAQFGIGTSS